MAEGKEVAEGEEEELREEKKIKKVEGRDV